tara:strand:+ start:16836 stop:17177 length:342 start_codon:yes stop_codon:yes gene_type:complete
MIILYSIASTAVILFCIFYIRYLLRKLVFFAENIDGLREEIEEYNTHLKSLYEMEMFYGDETIQGMIEHTTHVLNKVEDFEEFYSLLPDPDDNIEEEDARVPAEKNPTQTEKI